MLSNGTEFLHWRVQEAQTIACPQQGHATAGSPQIIHSIGSDVAAAVLKEGDVRASPDVEVEPTWGTRVWLATVEVGSISIGADVGKDRSTPLEEIARLPEIGSAPDPRNPMLGEGGGAEENADEEALPQARA